MASLKGSKTEVNVMTAFAGESQARNRYTFFSKAAVSEGYVRIGKIFKETGKQECQHAKALFKLLEGGDVTINAAFPAGKIADTVENLKAAAAGEHFENQTMYPDFAKTADEEGFKQIANMMRSIAMAETFHESRYLKMASQLDKGNHFKKGSVYVWRCLNCGYIHVGTEAPTACPACFHPKSYFAAMGTKEEFLAKYDMKLA